MKTNKFAQLFAAFVVSAFSAHLASAQTYQTWRDPDAANGNWHQANAWWNFPNGSSIVFGQQQWNNNHYLSQTNNNGGSEFGTWQWVFQSGASSAHTFTGDAVRFYDYNGSDPMIQNESSATHTINNNISGDGDSADPFSININGSGGLTFGGTVNNQGATINVGGSTSSSATVRFNGIVSGNGGMYVNNGNLTVLMDAANTQSGQLTINAGTVRLNGSGDQFGGSSQAIRVGSGATLDLNNVSTTVGSIGEEGSGDGGSVSLGSATLTIGGSSSTSQSTISGTGGITHSGSGSLALYNTQTYTGTTAVSAGTVSSSGAMSSTNYNLTGTGTFETSAGNVISDTAAITLGGGTLKVGGGETIGNNGVTLSANSTTEVTGANALTVGGAITGSGRLTKTGTGTLILNGANTYNGGTVVSAGTLQGTASTIQGAVTNNAAVNFNQTADGTYSGNMVGTGGKLVKSGSATLTLSGNNSYSGNTEIDAGALAIGGGNIASGSTIYIGNGGNASDAALRVSGTTALQNNIEVNTSSGSGSRTIAKTDATSQTASGSVTLNRAATFDVANSGNLNLSGVVSGANAMTKTGSGTLVLSGSGNNTASGDVSVNAGTLVLNKTAGTDAIAGNITVANSAVLTNSAANQINNADSVTINNGGTWALGGNNETVATLDVDGSLTLGAGQVIVNGGSGEWSGAVSGANNSSIVFKGGGTTSLTGNNSGLASGSALYVEDGVTVGLNNNNAAGSSTIYLGSTSDSSTAKLDSSVSDTTIGADIVVRSGSSGNKTIDNATTSGSRQITFNGNVSLADTLYVDASSGETTVFGGVISNTAGIVKRGFGTMTIGGVSTFGGVMAIDEGSLRVASGGDLTAASNITIGSSIYNDGAGAANLTLASGASGIDRGIVVAGGTAAGSRLLASEGNNTVSGTITQSANLTVSNSTGTLNLSAVNMSTSGNNDLNVNGAGNVTIGGTITAATGASEIFKSDAGTLTISGDNSGSSYKLHLNSGTTILGSANSLGTAYSDKVNFDGTSTLRVSANVAPNSLGLRVGNGITGTVQVDSGNNFSVSTLGSSGGTGTFNKTGTGTLTLTGTSTTANANNVNAGTLFVSSGAALAGTTTVSSGGTLAGSGSVGATTITNGGRISPGNSPGTLSLTNGLTWGAGGNYDWQIYNATGTMGSTNGWDLIAVTGAAWDITGLSSLNPFNINLWSLSGISPDANGNAVNFNNTVTNSWEILTYTSLNGTFNSNLFAINTGPVGPTGGFANALGGGVFSLAVDGNSLNLLFTPGGGPGPSPVPEPGTWAAAALLAGAAGYVRWRRRKQDEPKA